ncbi:MAG: hypothetical protein NUV63_01485 [Gallionella sp.]|nr:hypothetical protein [Gallionella sp.]
MQDTLERAWSKLHLWQRGSDMRAWMFSIMHNTFINHIRRKQLVTASMDDEALNVSASATHDNYYELLGGRLLPGNQRPAAQFMHQDARGLRLTLYLSNKPADKGEAAFHYAQEGKVSVFYWIDNDMSYALSGEMGKADLLRIANAVYQGLNSWRLQII